MSPTARRVSSPGPSHSNREPNLAYHSPWADGEAEDLCSALEEDELLKSDDLLELPDSLIDESPSASLPGL
jgi:hypothetical protein